MIDASTTINYPLPPPDHHHAIQLPYLGVMSDLRSHRINLKTITGDFSSYELGPKVLKIEFWLTSGLGWVTANRIQELSENLILKIEFQVNAGTRWEWDGTN